MKVLKLISLLLFVSLLLASGVAIAVAGKEKVTLCHKPGTPAEGTLEVAEAAVQAHLDHGDVSGACAPPQWSVVDRVKRSGFGSQEYRAAYRNLLFEATRWSPSPARTGVRCATSTVWRPSLCVQ
jgi:hypothetical protein